MPYFCLIMNPFTGEVPVFARLWPSGVRVRVSFTTRTVRSAILATAGLLVRPLCSNISKTVQDMNKVSAGGKVTVGLTSYWPYMIHASETVSYGRAPCLSCISCCIFHYYRRTESNTLLRYHDFSIFQDGGRPPCWIIKFR